MSKGPRSKPPDEILMTQKVNLRPPKPLPEPEDFASDSSRQTRLLLNSLHALVLGRYWAWFWGPLIALAGVVMVVLALDRGKGPVLDDKASMLCTSGSVRLMHGPLARWQVAKRVPEGVRASTSGPRSRHTVLILRHDSTVRWQGSSIFTWHTGSNGKTSMTMERGRAWIALSPLDSLRVDFPGGWADLAPASVAEINLRPRAPAKVVVRCRFGQVHAHFHRASSRRSGQERQTQLADGQGVQALNDDRVQTVPHFNADDAWQSWNLSLPGPALR